MTLKLTNKKQERIFFAVLILALIALILGAVLSYSSDVAYADSANDDVEQKLEDNVDSAIDKLDMGDFEKFLKSLEESQKEALSMGSLKGMLKSITESGAGNFFQNFFNALYRAAGNYFLGFLPVFMTVIVIALLKNMLTGMTGNFQNTSTTEVVHIVCYSAIIVVMMTGVVGIIKTVMDTISNLSTFSSALFPVILTLLAALGGASGVSTYQPLMAVLSGTIIKIIEAVVLPAFIATIVFAVVGNLSKNVKLTKLNKFFRSGATWLIGIVFGLFSTFLTAQGITGGVVDRLGFNAAKFAMSSYVPILGGYLSDGFDLLSASVVLVKNAVGFTGVLVLLSLILFPLLKLVVFMLTLRMTSAVVEPIGDERVSSMMSSLADNMSLLITALIGVGFMFFILLMLVLGSCNLGV